MVIRKIVGFAVCFGLFAQVVAQEQKNTVSELRKKAEKGDIVAADTLGGMYNLGEGVTQDFEEAFKWYRKGADGGSANSQYNLGVMYYHGRAVSRNYGKAVKLFRKAADQGNAAAMAGLGLAQADGHGVRKDPVEALKWHILAKQGGYDGASRQRVSLERRMTPKQVAEAGERARKRKPGKAGSR